MTKSELIDHIAGKQTQLSSKDVELAIKAILENMSQVLSGGGRIEIRGFGSFSLHYRVPRVGRNPKTEHGGKGAQEGQAEFGQHKTIQELGLKITAIPTS